MKYVLRVEETGEQVLEAEFPDNFAAEKWARDWAREHGKHERYLLERADAGFAELLFKTVAGQWYLTPRSALSR